MKGIHENGSKEVHRNCSATDSHSKDAIKLTFGLCPIQDPSLTNFEIHFP